MKGANLGYLYFLFIFPLQWGAVWRYKEFLDHLIDEELETPRVWVATSPRLDLRALFLINELEMKASFDHHVLIWEVGGFTIKNCRNNSAGVLKP